MDFTEFNLDGRLLKGLEDAGYTNCTEVQEQVLKNSQDGSDLYVQSQTGTGKTAAYLVAIIQELLSKDEKKGKKVLVLVPTRELAVQVEEEAKVLAGPAGLSAFSFYGGVGYEKQIAAIKKGVDIIVSTPGRLIDLREGGNIDLADVAFLVCDEADRMFDMGFYPDLRTILKFIPKSEERQTMLFSATLNTYVKNLAWEYTREPKEIEIAAENITVSEIDQELLHVSSDEKMKLLLGILKNETPSSVIIFCNTKRMCEVVAKRLEINGLKCEFLIGDLPQKKRLEILNNVKAGKVAVLVATDVAARGIDVDDLAMVINYDLPNEAENYVHRIGRTARAGKSGKAYTFCSEQDVYNLPAIERFIEMQIPSKVAYPEQMIEDSSAGIYIRTQNWHDDDEEPRGGRKGRASYGKGEKQAHRKEGFRDSKGDFKKGGRKDSGKKNFGKKDGDWKDGSDFKNHSFKKDSWKGSSKKDGKRVYSQTSREDFEKLESMSSDERMKYYKEKYAFSKASSSSSNSYSGKNKKGGGKNDGRFDGKKSSGYGKSRNGVNKGYPSGKSGKKKNYDAENGKRSGVKATEKKGFLAKLKALFGR